MSKDFVKLYEGFFEGSLRDQPPYARLLFGAMCFKADAHGIVLGTVSFWASYVNISRKEVEQALKILSSPDPDSTSPEYEGRRIEPWGDGANRWRVINHGKYYEKSRSEDRRAYKTEWERQKRAKDGSGAPKEPNAPPETVHNSPHKSTVDKTDNVDRKRKGKENKQKEKERTPVQEGADAKTPEGSLTSLSQIGADPGELLAKVLEPDPEPRKREFAPYHNALPEEADV